MQRETRIEALDGVRGLAVLAVIVFHCSFAWTSHSLLARSVQAIQGFGLLGVDMFFALSGFLITGKLLDAKGGPDYFRGFYVRRFRRIFPLYYAVLFVYFLLVRPTGEAYCPGRYFFYIANLCPFFRTPPAAYLVHFWSLSVEEQFYIFWPLVVWGASRKTLVKVAFLLCLVSQFVRLWLSLHLYGGPVIYSFTLSRMDALVLGAAAAVVVRESLWLSWFAPRLKWLIPLLMIVVLAECAFRRTVAWYDLQVWSVWFADAASALFVLWSAIYSSRLLSNRMLRSIGKYSYAMYVFHFFLTAYISKQGFYTDSGLLYVLWVFAVILGSYGAARVSWVLIENPCLKMGKSRLV